MASLKEKFFNDGFVVLEKFLSDADVEELRNEAFSLIEKMPADNSNVFDTVESSKLQNRNQHFLESADKISYFFEKEALDANGALRVDAKVSLNKMGHALGELSPKFRQVTFSEKVKSFLHQLDYEEPTLVQSMYIFKNPGIGSAVTHHQDASYLHSRNTDKLIGVWFALDDATEENGCLWFSRASHKSGEVHRRYIRNPDVSSDELLVYDRPAPNYDNLEFSMVPVKKGSCVLIHGLVVHYSEPNKSIKPRHAYTFHVVDLKDNEFSKENWIRRPASNPFLNIYENN